MLCHGFVFILFSQVEARGGEVDGKIKKLDEELLRYAAVVDS